MEKKLGETGGQARRAVLRRHQAAKLGRRLSTPLSIRDHGVSNVAYTAAIPFSPLHILETEDWHCVFIAVAWSGLSVDNV
jgi:hypothetical protein